MFAGPGCGKSTCAAGVFSLLKMHNVNAELITEFAKDLTWEKRQFTIANQYYVWGKQHHKQWRVKDQVDVMITDSPILLSQIYGIDNPPCFDETILKAFNEFNNLNFFLIRTKEKKYNTAGRNQDEAGAKEIDTRVQDMLYRNKIPYHGILANCDGINTMAGIVLDSLGIKFRIGLCVREV